MEGCYSLRGAVRNHAPRILGEGQRDILDNPVIQQLTVFPDEILLEMLHCIRSKLQMRHSGVLGKAGVLAEFGGDVLREQEGVCSQTIFFIQQSIDVLLEAGGEQIAFPVGSFD